MSHPAQWVRLYRLGSPYPAEIVHARYVEHRFARHAHEHLVVGLIEEGTQQYTYRRSLHKTSAGQIFFVDGGEPHTGEPATHDGYIYRTLCLSPAVFRQLAFDITDREELPHLSGAVVANQPLVRQLRRLHWAAAKPAQTMEQESCLLAVVESLLAKHVENRRESLQVCKENFVVTRAREYLNEHYAEDISLAQLAAITSRSPFHFARAFSRALGLPPHAYLESIRVQHAREMLRSGMSVVDTALSLGYSDQSHFTHRFRSHTGITPGQYRNYLH